MYYVPFPHVEGAKEVVRQLLEEKKIACANIFTEVESLYWWKDKIEEDSEVVVFMKSYGSLESHEVLRQQICNLHPYDCPCVTALKVEDVNGDFLQFLKDSTKCAD